MVDPNCYIYRKTPHPNLSLFEKLNAFFFENQTAKISYLPVNCQQSNMSLTHAYQAFSCLHFPYTIEA